MQELYAELADALGTSPGQCAANRFAETLVQNAVRFPDRPAIVDVQTRISHGELFAACVRKARELRASGIARGQQLELYLGNRIDSAVLMLSCTLLETRSVLRAGHATDDRASYAQTGPTDPTGAGEIVVATSGTTVTPKLVRHGFDSVLYSA